MQVERHHYMITKGVWHSNCIRLLNDLYDMPTIYTIYSSFRIHHKDIGTGPDFIISGKIISGKLFFQKSNKKRPKSQGALRLLSSFYTLYQCLRSRSRSLINQELILEGLSVTAFAPPQILHNLWNIVHFVLLTLTFF